MVPKASLQSSDGKSTLDRLKALDALPNLEPQLEEIQQLCTHPARAEMILRWVLSKVQSDSEVRSASELWDAFLTTLRFLSPERIASLLGPSNFLRTLDTTLAEVKNDCNDLLSAVARLLAFLIEQGDTPTGAPVKAVLTLPALEAATFVGRWLEKTSKAEPVAAETMVNLQSNILPALKIWGLRKSASDENEHFSKHCLVPIAHILPALVRMSSPSKKRKRSFAGEDLGQPDIRGRLEALLARHIFLPARSAFFKAQTPSDGIRKRAIGSQRPSFILENLLEPLAINGPSGVESAIKALPLLLDIALRSAPAPSPKQRLLEKPWVEALWEALHNCNKHSADKLRSPGVLLEMLSVMSQTSSLSKETLNAIVSTYANLTGAEQQETHWPLVARVVNVNAEVFLDNEMAETLFLNITRASIKLGEDASLRKMDDDLNTVPDSLPETLYSLWKGDIVVPVMKAFARNRRLPQFIRSWQAQLKIDLHGTFWSVWTQLDHDIRPLLRESLTDQVVDELVRQLCSTIVQANDHRDVRDLPELGASIVMLNAVLGGIQSDAVLDELHAQLESTFTALISLATAHIGPGLIPALQARRSWALLTLLFETWFPRWAAQQTDGAAVVTKISNIVISEVLELAMTTSSTVHPEEYGSVEDPESASAAKCFAGSICSCLLRYQQHMGKENMQSISGIVDKLGDADRLNASALIRHPTLLAHMRPVTRITLLTSYVKNSMTSQEDLQTIKAILSGIVSCLQKDVIVVFV